MLKTDLLKKAGIGNADIQQLQTALNAYQNARKQPQHKNPHIVCTGIYNAGKSTLLNALIGEEKFPTGDIPTTKALAQAESGGAVYIDTPGLNAAEEDDRETRAAYESADFILFVSNAQNGGISAAEAVWLGGLRERYTTDGLEKRLIFVLTHCTQVDPEQLPTIQEKVRGDFRKALGFELEPLLCVDSVTYQKGVKENKPVLVEHSGIRGIQHQIAKKLQQAEVLLTQARTAQREATLDLIKELRAQCQRQRAGASASAQKKEVDRLLTKAGSELNEACKESIYIGDTYVYCSPGKTRFRRLGVLGSISAEEDAKKALNHYGSKCVSEAKDKLNACIRQIQKRYCNTGIDSAYHKYCNSVNQILESTALSLQQQGIAVQAMEAIQVQPDSDDLSSLPSKIARDRSEEFGIHFREGKGLFDTYYDLSGHWFESRTITEGHYKKTLFGEKWVEEEGTEINAYDAMQNTLKDVQEQMERFEEMAKFDISLILQSFLDKLRTSADEYLKKLRAAANTSLNAAERAAAAPYQAAIDTLSEMEQEIKAWQI